jgi:hypothetical protein
MTPPPDTPPDNGFAPLDLDGLREMARVKVRPGRVDPHHREVQRGDDLGAGVAAAEMAVARGHEHRRDVEAVDPRATPPRPCTRR